jgi:CDP-paratose 2-epimerase
MKTIIITGSAGLIGSDSVRFYAEEKFNVIGIDNNMRKYFFGDDASTDQTLDELIYSFNNFKNFHIDVRDYTEIKNVFSTYQSDVELVIHTAAQPSHDWAAKEPFTDFTINANGTLNLLEATRQFAPNAVFIFTSTNKVYGDLPNYLPLVEEETRWEISKDHAYYKNGIDEKMSIDNCQHSLFGASKVAADVLVQEYGKYFGMKTGVFRGGCLTGPSHSGAELHGFLAYLMKCAVTKKEYKIFGYKGKQVRDNIHGTDLVLAFNQFFKNPRCSEVYNIGGSRFSNCSIIEALKLCEEITGNKVKTAYLENNRIGDHIWWISDVSKFRSHFPNWNHTKSLQDILGEIFSFNKDKWLKG